MTMSVHNYIDENRLEKLTSLQEKFLKHAMNSFPKAKRIVYSTCSLYPEENERVIANVVKMSRAKWRVQNLNDLLKGQWNNFGSAMYGSTGTRCLYAKPDSDMTTGFFLAVLDRDEKDLAKVYRQEEKEVRDERKVTEKLKKVKNKDVSEGDIADEIPDNNTKKRKKEADEESVVENNKDSHDIDSELTPKKKKKKDKEQSTKRKHNFEDQNGQSLDTIINNLEDLNVVGQDKELSKKKKKKKDEENSLLDTTNSNDNSVVDTHSDDITKKSKKSKKRKIDEENVTAEDVDQEKTESPDILCKKSKKKKKKNQDVEN